MSATVFIDGDEGTTGLKIRSHLEGRTDLTLIRLPDDQRKNASRRKEALNNSDVAILCLPDDAALHALNMVENPGTRIIDASTAHRIADGWDYGFPEYNSTQARIIAASSRVSNPGCYAITSIAILHPLIISGVLPADWPITINAVSGYSGGGKNLIKTFEDTNAKSYKNYPFYSYSLGLKHKHVPEIKKWSGLARPPLFLPSVGRYLQGMIVQVPLPLWAMRNTPKPEDVHSALSDHYSGCLFVSVDKMAESGAIEKLHPEALNGTNKLHLHVFANKDLEQVVVIGVIDNLGKGAAGQAVQNMNIILELAEDTGLRV